MKLRHYLLLQGISHSLIALSAAAMPFLFIPNSAWWILVLLIGLYSAYAAYRSFAASRHARDEDRAYGPPTDATPQEQLAYYKSYRSWLYTLIAFVGISIWTAIDLHDLETGRVNKAKLVIPVNLIYPRYGFWPAALTYPALGSLLMVGFWLRINRLQGEVDAEILDAEA